MSDDAQALYVQALKKHRNGDYAQAVNLAERAVAADPQHTDAWEALGVLYDKVDQLDDAIQATERLLELAPDEIMGWTNLSRFQMKKGEITKAEDAQAKARLLGWKQELATGEVGDNALQQSGGDASTPASSAPVDIAGLARQTPAPTAPPTAPDKEGLERRIRQFEAILSTNPTDLLARLTLGKAYLQAERFDDAVRALKQLVADEPERSAAYPILGQAYEGLGKRARAMSTYETGIAIAEKKGDLHPRNLMKEALTRLG